LVLSGALGDQGFYDDSARGMTLLEEDGYRTDVLEGKANNPAQWKQNLQLAAQADWDIVVTGTSQQADNLLDVAGQFPDRPFINFDNVVDAPNVASIVYRQNEGSFLAGVLAGLATTDPATFPLSNDDLVVGVVAGVEIPVLQDFVVGFQAGVAAVNPNIKVLSSFVGSFEDPNAGYDQGKAMFDQGADVVYAVAGGSGLGVLKAAADSGRYAIGVDQDQSQIQPGHVLASMLKNVGGSIQDAVHKFEDGDLKLGSTTFYGLDNGGVSLVYAKDLVPTVVIDAVAEYADRVVAGELKVPTAL